MFRRAVVCTDLSDSSGSIIGCAGQLGTLGVASAVLVHVIELDRPAAAPDAHDDSVFCHQADELERAGIHVSVDTSVGYAPYEIERLAVEHDAGLIVAGSHGKGLLDGVMSGSVSSDLIRIAERPLLLTAPSTKGDPESASHSCAALLGHILFPCDFSPASERAGRLVLDLAERGVDAVTLMHVVGQTADGERESSADAARTRLAAFAARLDDVGVHEVQIDVCAGDVERTVAKASAGGQYTLIVLAPHCGSGSDAALDSVTDTVLQRTATPVLLAPPKWRP